MAAPKGCFPIILVFFVAGGLGTILYIILAAESVTDEFLRTPNDVLHKIVMHKTPETTHYTVTSPTEVEDGNDTVETTVSDSATQTVPAQLTTYQADYNQQNLTQQLRLEQAQEAQEQQLLQEERLLAEELVTSEPNDEALKLLLSKELPNVPFPYWIDNQHKRLELNKTCAKFPNLYELDMYNTRWQTFQLANVTFRLYGAYYDNRASVREGHVVRILAMANQLGYKFANSSCQLWFDEEPRPQIVPVISYQQMWPTYWGRQLHAFYGHLLTCKVPNATRVPKAVSLVTETCEQARNSLRVHYEPAARKQRFAVCVKGLDFPYKDISVRLIEWLEVLRILGAAKVFIYYFSIHPRVAQTLAHYQHAGFVELTAATMAHGVPNTVHYRHLVLQRMQFNKRQNELVPYNECLYRNMYKYDYLSGVDIDEVIMPRGNLTNWEQLMQQAEAMARRTHSKCPHGYVSICFRNDYVADHMLSEPAGIPNYLYMLRHTQRLEQHSRVGVATKCFHNTTEALTLHNHYALFKLKACLPTTLDLNLGHLLHYHQLKPSDINNVTVPETDLQRFSDLIVRRTRKVLLKLGFLVTPGKEATAPS